MKNRKFNTKNGNVIVADTVNRNRGAIYMDWEYNGKREWADGEFEMIEDENGKEAYYHAVYGEDDNILYEVVGY